MSRLITYVSFFALLAITLSSSAPEAGAQTLDARAFIIIVQGDSAKEWIELDTIAVRNYIRRVCGILDSTGSGGGISASTLIDSLNALMTLTTGRLLHYSNIQPGPEGNVLMTVSGAAVWSDQIPRAASTTFYLGSAVSPHNPADTTSNKHLLYATQLSREYPVAQGTSYSGLRVNIYVRGGDATSGFGSYSSTMTAVGAGAGAIQAGDKLAMRFFPKLGTGTDKVLKVYRVPDGTHVIGGGMGLIYGQEIGTINVPAAKFPLTTTCNMEVTFSYIAK